MGMLELNPNRHVERPATNRLNYGKIKNIGSSLFRAVSFCTGSIVLPKELN
jgi:hypothetical protein